MSEARHDTGVPHVDHVISILEGCRASLVVAGACELEVFDLIGQSNDVTSSSLSTSQGWDQDETSRLLDALTSLKLLEKDLTLQEQCCYRLSASGDYLRRHKPVSAWGVATSIKRLLPGLAGGLVNEVKTGNNKAAAFPKQVTVHKDKESHKAVLTGTEVNEAGEAEHHGSHQHHGGHHHHHHHGHQPRDPEALMARYRMYEGVMKPHVHALVTAFNLSHYKSCVDLGGGAGTFAFEMAKTYPKMAVTIFEVPPVVELIKSYFAKEQNPDVQLVSGDFFEVDIPQAELFILGKIVHDWSENQVNTLLRKVFNKTPSGGGVILLEKCMNDARDGPASAHMWDMMVMSHCAGQLRSGAEYRQLLQAIGYTGVQLYKTQETCSYDVIYARKP